MATFNVFLNHRDRPVTIVADGFTRIPRNDGKTDVTFNKGHVDVAMFVDVIAVADAQHTPHAINQGAYYAAMCDIVTIASSPRFFDRGRALKKILACARACLSAGESKA